MTGSYYGLTYATVDISTPAGLADVTKLRTEGWKILRKGRHLVWMRKVGLKTLKAAS